MQPEDDERLHGEHGEVVAENANALREPQAAERTIGEHGAGSRINCYHAGDPTLGC